MHYLLGLAALVMGAVIATRRTRPTWFVVTTSVLVGIGALLAILSYTRVTDSLGLVANSILGWVFVGFALITMFASIFVLERRGPRGEELPPLIGDNPLDGDTDDSDDPAPGTAPAAAAAAPAAAAATGDVTPEQGRATTPAPTDPGYDAWEAAGEPDAAASDGADVVGADPDLATDPASTDVDAAPEGDRLTDGTDRTDRA